VSKASDLTFFQPLLPEEYRLSFEYPQGRNALSHRDINNLEIQGKISNTNAYCLDYQRTGKNQDIKGKLIIQNALLYFKILDDACDGMLNQQNFILTKRETFHV
jgi:hypothetical protein